MYWPRYKNKTYNTYKAGKINHERIRTPAQIPGDVFAMNIKRASRGTCDIKSFLSVMLGMCYIELAANEVFFHGEEIPWKRMLH